MAAQTQGKYKHVTAVLAPFWGVFSHSQVDVIAETCWYEE
jgi:hypothetical protein